MRSFLRHSWSAFHQFIVWAAVIALTATAAAAADPPPKRVPAHPSLTAKGIEGVGLTAEQVNSAIDRGAAFLWNHIKSADLEKRHETLGDDQEHVLACLALVHSDAARKFPDFDKALREYLARPKDYGRLGTYQAGLMCMLIEAYGDPQYFRQQREAVRYLIEMQGEKGTWSYGSYLPMAPAGAGEPGKPGGPPLLVLGGPSVAGGGPGMARELDWKVGKDGDNSCSQFALLGLSAASRCNNKTAAELWKRSLDAHTRRQSKQGWGYSDNDIYPYGSMTCAGICAVAIDQFELGVEHPETDERIEHGLAWMDDNFSVSTNPQKDNYLYYYLYSLERVGRILDTEFIGSHEWYPLGARQLVDSQQKDGKWLEQITGDDPRVPTSFALLFLTRATPKLHVEVKHGGPGRLLANIESQPPTRLYIILDASGSMIDLMEGRRKFDVARDAVTAVLNALPDNTEVALRVYGHRKSSIEKDSDLDTNLEIRMGPLDRQKFGVKLASLRARGKTPLALSLQDAMSDLADVSPAYPATLILLTDGGEDTMPRRNPVKVADELRKHPGITFQIIGFDINQEDWGQQLRAMADHGGGLYWPAARPDELVQQLVSAVLGKPQAYEVMDKDGHVVAQGSYGQPLSLPEGTYRLKTVYAGREFSAEFSIATDVTTSVMFDAGRIPVQPVGAESPSNASTSSATPKFCTHCGKPLPTGAKFCPNCGAAVKGN